MVVSFQNDGGIVDGGERQEHKPQTVSSLSSLETTDLDQCDMVGVGTNNAQQSTLASLSPLPTITGASGSNSTVVTSSTTVAAPISSADTHYSVTAGSNGNHNTYIGGPMVQPLDPAGAPVHSHTGSSGIQIAPSASVLVSATPNTNTVPEFLYQLTKMLTDNNRDIIEWSNGKIEVHSPHKLETHVLNRYFRHSKFASFQRQLNYFGFRKLAGKGKMAPCSYVNDATTDELGSLLLIKRKQGNEQKTKVGGKKRGRTGKDMKSGMSGTATTKPGVDNQNQALHGISYRANTGENNQLSASIINGASLHPTQKALARVAVGKGVRHGYVPQPTKNFPKSNVQSSTVMYTQRAQVPATASTPVEESLNALTQNFNQSLNESTENNVSTLTVSSATSANTTGRVSYVPGSLHRDDSLVDLAMIPIMGDGDATDSNAATASGFSFVDFPFDSNIFANEDPHI